MAREANRICLNHGPANQNAPNRPQRRQRRCSDGGVTDGHDPPAGRSKRLSPPAKLQLQPAANAGELGSFFTNQKRSARPEFIEQRRFSDPRRTDYQDVATLQIKCPQLFKFRISAGKRKSHIDDPERVPPDRNLSISLTSDRVRFSRTFWNRTSRAKSRGRRSITAPS